MTLGHSPKIVGQIRRLFSFGGTLTWATSPSWPPQNRRLDPLLVQVPAGVMRLTTVNEQNRAAFVDNKRNIRKCNCHTPVTLIGSILSLVIILRITTKSQSSKNKSSARLRAPRLSEPMTAADRAVVALRTRRHNRSK